jgi:hypothetical protein
MKRNGPRSHPPGPSTKSINKSPAHSFFKFKSSPFTLQIQVCRTRGSWNNLKKRGKNDSQASFSLLSLDTVLKALKGYIPKEESDFQSYSNHDKNVGLLH